jgi:hypothetical protein
LEIKSGLGFGVSIVTILYKSIGKEIRHKKIFGKINMGLVANNFFF